MGSLRTREKRENGDNDDAHITRDFENPIE